MTAEADYYGVIGNSERLWDYAWNAKRLVLKWLNRRSQRRSYIWTTFEEAWERWEIPPPRVFEKPWPESRQNNPQPVGNVQPIRVRSPVTVGRSLRFAEINMKTLAAISLSLAFLCASIFAQEPKADLMDFVLPVPDNFVASAAGALKTRNENVTHYLKTQGIQFPDGARVELNDAKKILIVKLPHREALHLTQLVNAFMGDNADEFSREFLEGGAAIEGPENRCFGPLPK